MIVILEGVMVSFETQETDLKKKKKKKKKKKPKFKGCLVSLFLQTIPKLKPKNNGTHRICFSLAKCFKKRILKIMSQIYEFSKKTFRCRIAYSFSKKD